FTMQASETAPGVRRFVTPVTGTASVANPLTTQIKIDVASLRQVTRIGAFASGDDLLVLAQPRTAALLGPKVVAIVRNITVAKPSDTQFRLYLGAERTPGSTPTSDPSYLGTFGFFGGAHAGHEGDKPSVLFDLTSTIRLLYRTEANTPDTLTIQIV